MMKKKILRGFLIAITITFSLISPKVVNAEQEVIPNQQSIIDETENLVAEALSEKTFYKYNVAYTKTLEIKNDSIRDSFLSQLGTIAGTVWTEDIKSINKTLETLVSTGGSGRIYDEIQNQITASELPNVDKEYLLGEVTSWGKRLVYTQDYGNAVDKVVKAWNKLNSNAEDSVSIDTYMANAEKAISSVKNSYSKDYLLEQLQEIKAKVLSNKPSVEAEDNILTVSIDPGHGGSDLGIVSAVEGIYEKDIALNVALKLGKILESNGVKVVYTRIDDSITWDKLDLSPRFKIANDNKADFFISIHANTATETSTGVETYYLKGNSKAQELANYLNKEIAAITGLTDRNKISDKGREAGAISELDGTNALGIKVFLGFLSNPEEAKKLSKNDFQDKAAQAMANVILKYKDNKNGANQNESNKLKVTALAEDETSTYYANYDYIVSKVKVGESYSFPSAVKVLMSDGSTQTMPITWSETPDTSKVGTYLYQGYIAGVSFPINLSLMVLENKTYKQIVFIDPGHGGYDSGAVGPNGTLEKDITLAVAKKLGAILEKQGIGVAYARTDDNYPKPTGTYPVSQDLQKRVDMSIIVKADYYISIHTNSFSGPGAFGTETYYFNGSTKGQQLASVVQNNLVKDLNSYNRGVKASNFYVLKYSDAPSILVELGFISNPEEEKLLNSEDYQDKSAKAIADAIK